MQENLINSVESTEDSGFQSNNIRDNVILKFFNLNKKKKILFL